MLIIVRIVRLSTWQDDESSYQVLLTKMTRDLVAGRLGSGFGLKELGEFRLRDLAAPELIFQAVRGARGRGQARVRGDRRERGPGRGRRPAPRWDRAGDRTNGGPPGSDDPGRTG
jgi:hypothetical protein